MTSALWGQEVAVFNLERARVSPLLWSLRLQDESFLGEVA